MHGFNFFGISVLKNNIKTTGSLFFGLPLGSYHFLDPGGHRVTLFHEVLLADVGGQDLDLGGELGH
jgi:hypothetical protein